MNMTNREAVNQLKRGRSVAAAKWLRYWRKWRVAYRNCWGAHLMYLLNHIISRSGVATGSLKPEMWFRSSSVERVFRAIAADDCSKQNWEKRKFPARFWEAQFCNSVIPVGTIGQVLATTRIQSFVGIWHEHMFHIARKSEKHYSVILMSMLRKSWILFLCVIHTPVGVPWQCTMVFCFFSKRLCIYNTQRQIHYRSVSQGSWTLWAPLYLTPFRKLLNT